MPNLDTLTDEMAAAIWSGETASIANFGENSEETKTPEAHVATQEPEVKEEPKQTGPISEEDLSNIWAQAEEEIKEDKTSTTPTTAQDVIKANQTTSTEVADDTKRGRKPTDLVAVVNQLVEEDILFGFEDEEINTIEDVKELIKANLKYKEENSFEDLWKKKVETFNPQIQAIVHYAEKGGQDITPLLRAMAEVDATDRMDIETEEGQESVVREVLKIKGFDEEEIKDQIETLKDLDKLKAKADKFKPELDKLKEQRIQLMLQEQEERELQAKEAARVYLQTIQNTLTKEEVGGLRLKREEKARIVDALAVPKHKSLNGYNVNEFIKVLEELQFGKNANYDHFLNIVHYAIDRDGFLNKVKESLKNDVIVDNVKKLKTSKTVMANTLEETETQSSNGKPTIQRAGFKNPFKK